MSFPIFFSIITVWLVVLSWYDCYYRRLPNVLTLGGAAVFLAVHIFNGSMVSSLLGGLLGAAFLLIPFLMHGAGAGDVKMFGAVGILTGFPLVLSAMFWSTVFGLILGVIMVIAGKTDAARLKHLWRCCTDRHYDRKAGKESLPEKQSEKVRIPFGVAIAAGCWVAKVLYVLSAR